MQGDALKKALRYRWLIFWILALGYVMVYFHRLCPAVVAEDMRRDLAAGGGLLGLLGSAYFYPYALMQLPAGLLSDSWGPRKTITLFFGVAFAGSVILGMAPNVYVAIAGRTIVGLGVAMLFVPTLKVLAEWFRVKEFAMMTGILMAMGGIGSYSAATPLAYLSNWIGWRQSFVVVGIFTLILGALVWALVRDRPADMGWPSPTEASGAEGESIGLMQGVKMVISLPRFWPLAGWFFFTCAIFFSFIGLWGGPFLMQIYGLTKAKAGHILSLAAIGMIVGSPFLSFLSNQVFRARKPVVIMASIFMGIITGMLYFFTQGIPTFLLYLICLGIGMFSGAVVTIGFTTNKELFPVSIAGTATGLVNFFPFLGGAVFQVILGAVLDSQGLTVSGGFTQQGFRYCLLVLFCCGLLALISSFFLKETMKPS
ncbi:MAG: MFS transporter [Desulfobacterales bacterium]|nr:MAG: MFS transporter [Desulfobacterales bacterium]